MLRLPIILFTALSVVAFSQAASAADLPIKAPVYKAPVRSAPTWTGCYVGANAGYGWRWSSLAQGLDAPPPFEPGFDGGSDTGGGPVGGGQVGCDYQTGPWVFGAQAMFNAADVAGSHGFTDFPQEVVGTRAKWFATFTGRVGYTVQPNTLVYVKGGLALLRNQYSDVCADDVACEGAYFGSISRTLRGWIVGGGLEHMFMPNWSVFVEYNYIGIGKHHEIMLYTDGDTFPYDYKDNFQAVLVGLNFRFGGLPR